MDRCQQLGQLHNEWKTKCQWCCEEEHQPQAFDGKLHQLEEEESLLWHHGQGPGVTVDRTQNACELAGEGIEYA